VTARIDDLALSQAALDEVLDLLELNGSGRRLVGRAQRWPENHFYGGLLIAQAIVAASRVAPDGQLPITVTCNFAQAGEQRVPVRYDVEVSVMRRRTTFCRVTATQIGVIATFDIVLSSWLSDDDGPSATSAPSVRTRLTGPDKLEPSHVMTRRVAAHVDPWWREPRAIDIRHVEVPPFVATRSDLDVSHVWARAAGKAPQNPVTQVALLAYASDMTMAEPLFHRLHRPMHTRSTTVVTLSFALRLARRPTMAEWHLIENSCEWVAERHAECRSVIRDDGGRTIASVSQVVAWRPND
jgi:acyl-CoA thioesterase-2